MNQSNFFLLASIISILTVMVITVSQFRGQTQEAKTLSSPISPALTPLPKTTHLPTAVLTATPTDTPKITVTPIREPTSQPPPAQDISQLIYPNSQKISLDQNSAVLESNDNVDTVTGWYKTKIKEMDMNATSFAVTRANDQILNKLVGADGKREVRIEISQEDSSAKVKINVSLSK